MTRRINRDNYVVLNRDEIEIEAFATRDEAVDFIKETVYGQDYDEKVDYIFDHIRVYRVTDGEKDELFVKAKPPQEFDVKIYDSEDDYHADCEDSDE